MMRLSNIYNLLRTLILICIFLPAHALSAIPGDVDHNCSVDLRDYQVFRSILGKCEGQTGYNGNIDYDNDGCISYLDYRIWYGYYRQFTYYDADKDGVADANDQCPDTTACAEVDENGCPLEQENQPPVADAGEDQIIALSEDQTTVDVQLDGSGSTDPDGTIASYTWTGDPDPEDIAQPVIPLPQGVHSFSLVVKDDRGAESTPDSVEIVVLGVPEIIPPPGVTSERTITLYGHTVPGVNVIVRGGVQEASGQADSGTGYFHVPVQLNSEENHLSIYAEYNGVESNPAHADIKQTSPGIILESISPDTGQAGSILTLTGSGFTPDKSLMGVYFKGSQQEAEGFVLEATETMMKVVVPFVFLNADEEIQVYVFSDTEMSNSLSFHVVPATDPTPDVQGNEVSDEIDLLTLKAQRTLGKLEQLVKPNVPEETWNRIEENMNRIITFLEDVKVSFPTDYDPQTLSALDSIFGSDIFLLISEKLDQANELLSHSTTGEAICNVAEVQEILNDIISILRWVDRALIAGEVICFFVCQPALPVLEVARQIVETVLDVLYAIRDILSAAAPTNADATSWHIDVVGPYEGVDPHILFTNTTDTLGLYADFSNGGFNRFIGRISTLGKIVLDLLDIDIGKITIEDVNVPSTAASLDTSLVSNITTGDNPDEAEDIHTLRVYNLSEDEDRRDVNIDVQASCGPYHYPDKICAGSGCLDPNLPEYPDLYETTVIDAPIIDGVMWNDEWDGWDVWGLGFTETCGDEFKVFWNGEEISCSCIAQLDTDSFIQTCYDEPGRIELMLVDLDDPYNQDLWRKGPAMSIGLPPYADVEIERIIPSSGYIGDIITISGKNFSPYLEDMTIDFFPLHGGAVITSIHPFEITVSSHTGGIDLLKFKVPEELHGYEGQTLKFILRLIVDYGAAPFAYGQFTLRKAESASWGDQDLIAFSEPHGYIRSALVSDITGDGINDLIVGVEQEQSGFGEVMGAVYIAFGPIEGTALPTGQQYIDMSYLSPDIHWDVVIYGDYNWCYSPDSNFCQRIGNSLATGDINGDGINDLLIGSTDLYEERVDLLNPNHDPMGHVGGAAYVYYGRPRDNWNRWYEISKGKYSIRIRGDNFRELGYRVAVADLNGDDYQDIIVSAPQQPFNPGQPDLDWSGRVYVIFGGNGLPQEIIVDNIHASIDGAVIQGESEWQSIMTTSYKGDGLGQGIAVGDINGDGLDDLIVGAPRYYRIYGPAGKRKGAAFIFYGNTNFGGSDGILNAFTLLDGEQDVLVFGPKITESYHDADPGWEVGKVMLISDLDGDGKGELILGSPGEFLDYEYIVGAGYGVPITEQIQEAQIGMVYIISGNSIPQTGIVEAYNEAQVKIYGSTVLSRFGTSLAAGDINGDGYKDLLVGAPGRISSEVPGSVWGFYGSSTLPSGEIHLIDRSGVPEDFLFRGDQAHPGWEQGFGTFVTIGDLNPFVGDDVLIIDPIARAPEPSTPGTWRDYSGMLYVFYEGSQISWPLTVYPESVTLDRCNDQQIFKIWGGSPPYSVYSLDLPDGVELDYQYGDDSFMVRVNDCVPSDIQPFNIFVNDQNLHHLTVTINFTQPDISVTPTSIDFGDIVGLYNIYPNYFPPRQTVTITNTGESDLEINSIYIFVGTQIGYIVYPGEEKYNIRLTTNCPDLLPPEDSCTATVTILPIEAGVINGTLRINSNDPDEGQLTVNITANVIARPDIDISPLSIEFIGIPLGTTSSQDVTITNNGLADLHISSISVGSTIHYTQTNDCPSALAPGASCTVTVTYDPVNQVYFTHWATLTITSDDPDEPSVEVTLSGYGIEPFLAVAPDMLDFGAALNDALLSIQNTNSTETLNWSIKDDLPSWLSISKMSGETGPGVFERLTVSVDRSGLQPGIYQHTLYVTSNGGSASVQVSMEVPPFISVSPDTIDFKEARKRVTLTINNNNPSTTLSWNITDSLPSWLTASQTSGDIAPGGSVSIYLYADRSGLTPDQTYTHTLSIISSGGDETIPVSMTVPVPLATFARYYGGDSAEHFSVIRQTSDGGFITAGLTNSFGIDSDTVWVLKLDSSGYIEWEKRPLVYGRAYDVRETEDGGYILVTSDYSALKWTGLSVIKLDQYGDIQWAKNYEGCIDDNSDDWGVNFAIELTPDGGYIVAGNTRDLPGNICASNYVIGHPDMWILKLDSSGNIQWQKTYGGADDDYANSIKQTSDGGYIVAGVTESFGTGNPDIWVLKIDSSGNIQWQKTFGGSDWDYAYEIQQTTDGGYVLSGLTFSFGGAWVIKLDTLGNIEWQKVYDGWDTYGNSIKQTSDGGYVVTGSYYRSGVGDDVLILKLDALGEIQWQKIYGGESVDVAYSIEQTFEGDYVLSGYTRSFRTTSYGSPNYDAFVLKVDEIGKIGQSCGLVDYSSITPVETSITGIDTFVTPVDSATTAQDIIYPVIDTSSVNEALCSETEEEAQQRPQIEIDVSPLSYDFSYWHPDLQIGDSASTVFTVRNEGYSSIMINTIYLTESSDFNQTNNCPSELGVAQSCEITVTFSPTVEGEQSATLAIESNDPDEGVININITGYAAPPWECPPEECPPIECPPDIPPVQCFGEGDGGIIIIPVP
jgi:hypothetical protein